MLNRSLRCLAAVRALGQLCAWPLCWRACQHAPTQVAGNDDRHEDRDDRDRPPRSGGHVVPTGVFQGWQPRPMPSKRWLTLRPSRKTASPAVSAGPMARSACCICCRSPPVLMPAR